MPLPNWVIMAKFLSVILVRARRLNYNAVSMLCLATAACFMHPHSVNQELMKSDGQSIARLFSLTFDLVS